MLITFLDLRCSCLSGWTVSCLEDLERPRASIVILGSAGDGLLEDALVDIGSVEVGCFKVGLLEAGVLQVLRVDAASILDTLDTLHKEHIGLLIT